MGQDKARVEVAGLPLILRVVAQCGYSPDEATVVAAPGRSYADLGLRTIEDAQAHEGPFSGLVTALGDAAAGPLLVVGWDEWGLRYTTLARDIAAFARRTFAMAALAFASCGPRRRGSRAFAGGGCSRVRLHSVAAPPFAE